MTKEQELLKLAREMDLEMYGEEQGTEGYHFKFTVKTIELGRTEEGLETFQKAWVAL